MQNDSVIDWIEKYVTAENIWFAKRLSANDTGATGGHQVGFYLPKGIAFEIFPSMQQETADNSKRTLSVKIDSHTGPLTEREVGITWYNQKTRNEVHITRFGGKGSPFQEHENTGALFIIVFLPRQSGEQQQCKIWLCKGIEEEDYLESKIGAVFPGQSNEWIPNQTKYDQPENTGSCWLSKHEIPEEWLTKMPSGKEIIKKTLELRPKNPKKTVDERLILRRNCEFEVFKSVEDAFYMDQIQKGFPTMEAFLSVAQSVLQSRKSRAGNSLEYHMIAIFEEEGLIQNFTFAYNPRIDGKRPDFLFPSVESYLKKPYSKGSTRMLAAKTTCKDRWRQVCNEVDRTRIPVIDLLTLQEGVSANQFGEMKDEGVRLVVPKGLHRSYPKSFRDELLTVKDYINEVVALVS